MNSALDSQIVTETDEIAPGNESGVECNTEPDKSDDFETVAEIETCPLAPEGIWHIGDRKVNARNVAAAEYLGCRVTENLNIYIRLRVKQWYRGIEDSGLPGFVNETEIEADIVSPYESDAINLAMRPEDVDTSFIPFEIGETYLFVLDRRLMPNRGAFESAVIYSTLVIPADRVSESTMDGNPLVWYMEDVDTLSGMTVDDLAAWFLEVFRDTEPWSGIAYLPSEDMNEIVDYADEVAVVTMGEVSWNLPNRITFIVKCRVDRVLKGGLTEGQTVNVYMSRSDYKEGETVLIALTDPVEASLYSYAYAAPRCIWPASEADAAMSSLK